MDRRAFLRMGACAGAGLVSGLGLGFGVMAGEAAARGPGSEESAKARRILEQVGAGKKGYPTTARDNVFTLAPGDILSFEVQSYCLDGNLAVPSDDEPMAFRPMKNYISPNLRNIYIALMRNASRGESQGIHMQQAVFTIRSEAFEQSSLLNGKDYAFANRLVPGAENALKKAPRPAEYTFEPGLSFWASKPMPGKERSYSMLTADGVAGQALGAGGLDMRVTIANGSSKTFVFDPTQWVLEPSRDVQSVALPLPTQVTLAKGSALAGTPESAPASAESPKSPKPSDASTKSVPSDAANGEGSAKKKPLDPRKDFAGH